MMFQSWWGVFLTMHIVQVGMYCNDTYIKAYKKLCIPVILLKRYCLKQNKNYQHFELIHLYSLIHSCLFLWFKNYAIKKMKFFYFFFFLASHYFKDQRQNLYVLTKWITEKRATLKVEQPLSCLLHQTKFYRD